MNVIVDTCIWSIALRRSRAAEGASAIELRTLIVDGAVQLLGPIRQEILSGIREELQFERLRDQLAAFPDIEVDQDDHVLAARFFNICRAAGVQGSNTDFLICAVAARHGLSIFTTDLDFEGYARHLPIELHRPLERG